MYKIQSKYNNDEHNNIESNQEKKVHSRAR